MSKINLIDLVSLQNETTALNTMRANNDAIEIASDDFLSRSGKAPNQMLADLDMNSNRILNLPRATHPTEPVRLQEVGDAPGYAEQAAASAAAAAVSAEEALEYRDETQVLRDEVFEHVIIAKNDWVLKVFAGDGVTTSFDLITDPGSLANIELIVDGVQQLASTMSLAGTTVTLSEAPAVSSDVSNPYNVQFRYGQSTTVGTPGDGTITSPKISNSAVTYQKLDSTFISDAPLKSTPVSADKILIENSATNSLAYSTLGDTFSALIPSKAFFTADKNGTDQTGIASITDTKVTFTNQVTDIGGFYDAVNSRWTPPAGPVLITASLGASGTLQAAGTMQCQIWKNGTKTKVNSTNGANTTTAGCSTTLIDIASGTDYYEVYTFITTSSGTATVTGTVRGTQFQGITL